MKSKKISSTSSRSPVIKPNINLLKLVLKKFSGNLIMWQQFNDIFEAAINKNENLSNFQKFPYLQGYLEGPALKCIEGMTLPNENYIQALKQLKDRYGNPELITSTHMSKLLKLEKVFNSKNVKELRNLYDKVESHIRSLLTAGIPQGNYGPFLIPIVLEKLLDDIKLEFSRKLGTDKWKIDEFLEIWKETIVARESCSFMKNHDHSEYRNHRFTTDSCFTGSRVSKCLFCEHNHFSDKCTFVTDLDKRGKIVWKNRLRFKCLYPGHSIKSCQKKGKSFLFFSCKSQNHHTVICEKLESPTPQTTENENKPDNGKTDVNLVTSKASDNKEKHQLPVKVFLDPGSQRTYLSQRLVDYLKLVPIGKQTMTIKTFGNENENSVEFKEYSFCARGISGGQNIYPRGFRVPLVCSPLSGQRVDFVKTMFLCLTSLDLADKGNGDSKIDLLIGEDFYWYITEEELRRLISDGLAAVHSKLGWLLRGPFDVSHCKESCSMNLAITHVLRVTVWSKEKHPLSGKIERFWNLDTIGIVEKERSVHEKFLDDISFHDNQYEVRLPFKEDNPVIEDNYELCKKRLSQLKRQIIN